MKPNVGILTTYFAANYGAMLQPFALKRTLEQMGCNVEIIRYKQKYIYQFYNPFYYKKFFSLHLRAVLTYILFYFKPSIKKELAFRKFMYKYLNPKKGFCKKIPDNKDIYFIGSDQLWRSFGNDETFDDVYMGFFKTKKDAKKIAYAVSGEKILFNHKNIEYLKKAFLNFNLISVREKQKAEEFTKHIGVKDIEVVLDPSLLADPQIYKELEIIDPAPNEKYVFFYFLRNCYAFLDKIYSYAQSINAKLVIMSEGYNRRIKKYENTHSNVLYLATEGEEYFLGAMKNAECIFTPSFHGTAFSIINQKRFFSLVLNDGYDTRCHDLLATLKLENRFLSIDSTIIEDPIAYEGPNKILKEHRQHSLNFIARALKLIEDEKI